MAGVCKRKLLAKEQGGSVGKVVTKRPEGLFKPTSTADDDPEILSLQPIPCRCDGSDPETHCAMDRCSTWQASARGRSWPRNRECQ